MAKIVAMTSDEINAIIEASIDGLEAQEALDLLENLSSDISHKIADVEEILEKEEEEQEEEDDGEDEATSAKNA